MGAAHGVAGDRAVFLSTLPGGRGDRRLALTFVVISAAMFCALAPFAKTPLVPVPAFIPVYESALGINYLITAVLLLGQFTILGSPALLILGGAYLSTASITVANALTFPGLFAPTGLLAAGPQSTAWLYMFWHGGFPVLVIGYAFLRRDAEEPGERRRRAGLAVLLTAAAAVALAASFALLATVGQRVLPALMSGNHYTPAQHVVMGTVWALSLLALIVLWSRTPHSVLDLWLMVVMCAWLFDIALAGMLNAARFDLGFYAGRLYGLLAASFVLIVLLTENGKLYARLVDVSRELDRQNRSLEQIVAERTQRLLQSEKVATMGSLLAGVAHELNNPLAIVMAHAQLLEEEAAGTDPDMEARTSKIVRATERCARIVKNFLALGRQRPPERDVVDVNGVIKHVLEMLSYGLRTEGVAVYTDLADPLPSLWADEHQLHQVLVNIITNAQHAMRAAPDPRRLRITTAPASGDRVRIAIADTGPGIPAELRDKVFEPFFTTKPAGEGTGLGLSLCRNIVAEHGGTMTVESEPGQGTTFVIELPIPTSIRQAAAAAPPRSAAVGPSKRLLVVDDEPDLASVLKEILTRAGHHVDVAHDGEAALVLLARTAYDLVLSDTKMPGMDGIGLYRELQRRFPGVSGRVIFLTGDVLSAEKRQFLESTGLPCLTKPFDVQEVGRLVHQQLRAK